MLILSSKSTVHPVAKSFFNRVRAGGGDVADKKAIIDFTTKLSRIVHPSLWICWPLRSQHNIGTGTTAFSLGGLGNFNGTLINGPAWGVDGVNFSAVSQYIMTSVTSIQPMTIFSAHRVDSNAAASRLWDSSSDQLLFVNSSSTTLEAGSPSLGTVGTIVLGTPFTSQVEFNGTSGSVSLNGAARTTRNMGTSALTNGLRIGSLSATQFGRICSFVLITPRSANLPLIHNLYKQTLGQGLALP